MIKFLDRYNNWSDIDFYSSNKKICEKKIKSK